MKKEFPVCPAELQSILSKELADLSLRYMIAMYWQGRSDKIPSPLMPLLDWLTRNGLPQGVSSSWSGFSHNQTSFVDMDHQSLLNHAMAFSEMACREAKK